MAFELPALPYAKSALEPHISAETLGYHHDHHHRTYVEKLNKLIAGTPLEKNGTRGNHSGNDPIRPKAAGQYLQQRRAGQEAQLSMELHAP